MSPTPLANWWVDSTGAWRRWERVDVPVDNFTVLNAPSAGTNAATAINAALASGPTFLNNGDYFCSGAILIPNGGHLRLAAGANLWRNFSSSGATSSSFIRQTNMASTFTGITIDGAGNIAATPGNAGNMIALKCNNVLVDGIRSTFWTGGRYAMVAGNNHVWQNCTWRGNPSSGSGSGGLRFAGGNNFLGQNLNIISGDDVFQNVPAGAPSDPLWNAFNSSGGKYVNCVGRSYSARLCVIGLQDSDTGGSVALGMNVSVDGFMFQNIKGFGGGTAVNIANHSSTGTISNIKFDNVQADQRLTQSPTQGQPGETYVQREATAGTPTMGNVSNIDFSGATFSLAGVTIYNKRSAKDLTYISQPAGGVSGVTTALLGSGNLALDPNTLL